MAPVDYSNIPSKTHHRTNSSGKLSMVWMGIQWLSKMRDPPWLLSPVTHSLKCRMKLVVSCSCSFPRLCIHHDLYGRPCRVEQDAKYTGPFIDGELPSLKPDPGLAKGFQLFRQIPRPHFLVAAGVLANYSIEIHIRYLTSCSFAVSIALSKFLHKACALFGRAKLLAA